MKAPKKSPKRHTAEEQGKAAGAVLAQNAADVLLRAFTNRPANGMSQSSQRFSDALDLLQEWAGDRATDPDFLNIFRELDEACGDCMVEHEDRAWHAAWALAMGLRSPTP